MKQKDTGEFSEYLEHYHQYQAKNEAIDGLRAYHGHVSDECWKKLLRAQNQFIAECSVVASQQNCSVIDVTITKDIQEPEIPKGSRKCKKCGRILELSERNFRRDNSKKSGFRAQCKLCLKDQDKRRREGILGSRCGTNGDGDADADSEKRLKTLATVAQLDAVSDDFHTRRNGCLPVEEGRGCFSLNKDGLQVFKSMVSISEEEFGLLEACSCLDDYVETLFNNEAVDHTLNDKLRKQIPFETFIDDKKYAALELFQQEIYEKLRRQFPEHTPREMVILRSEAGCKSQRAHTDYLPKDLKKMNGQVPLACIIAVQNETWFECWPGAFDCFDGSNSFEFQKLVLNAGDVLVFRGDFVHAGAAFDDCNIRVHVYLDVVEGQRTTNATNFMDVDKRFAKNVNGL